MIFKDLYEDLNYPYSKTREKIWEYIKQKDIDYPMESFSREEFARAIAKGTYTKEMIKQEFNLSEYQLHKYKTSLGRIISRVRKPDLNYLRDWTIYNEIMSLDLDSFVQVLFDFKNSQKLNTLEEIKSWLSTHVINMPKYEEEKKFLDLQDEKERIEKEKNYKFWGITSEQGQKEFCSTRGTYTLEEEFEHINNQARWTWDNSDSMPKNLKIIRDFCEKNTYTKIVIPEIVKFLCKKYNIPYEEIDNTFQIGDKVRRKKIFRDSVGPKFIENYSLTILRFNNRGNAVCDFDGGKPIVLPLEVLEKA